MLDSDGNGQITQKEMKKLFCGTEQAERNFEETWMHILKEVD